jgi:pSer/pThr/pTyr-binding forkhead associated (FHA) protein
MAGLYLRDLCAELRQTGEAEFRIKYRDPVLVITGRAAELEDPTGGDRTAHTSPVVTAQEIALFHRVFILKKKDAAPGPISLGRSTHNDVTIAEYSISKKHCVFTRAGGGLHIVDCGSTNGTAVDGLALGTNKPRALKGGEAIAIGRFAFVLQTADTLPQYVSERGG